MDSIKKAADMLFGADGIGATNVRLFPGSSNDITPDQRAEHLVTVLEKLRKGDFDIAR